MQRLKVLGLALVAVFAMSAVASATASAANPELVKEGKAGTALVKNIVTSKNKTGSAISLVTVSGTKITCTAFTGKSTASTVKKTVKATVKFTGCENTGTKVKCKGGPGAVNAGEINTNELEGELGYISSAEKTVGIELWPSSRTATEKEKHTFEALFVEFECSVLAKSKVKGAVIGQVAAASINKLIGTTETMGIDYAQTTGKQKVTKLEGVEGGTAVHLNSSIDGSAFEESAEEATNLNSFEEQVELLA